MQYSTSSLGYDLKFRGPDSVEEYNQKAGRPNAVLEDAVDNEIYRGTLPDWQDAWVKKLQETTNITRNSDDAATEKARERAKKTALEKGKTEAEATEAANKVKASLESEKSYNLRVRAAVRAGEVPGVDEEKLKALAQEVADTIEINPAPSQRQGPPKKSDLEKADSLLAGDPDTLEGKIAVWSTSVDIDIQRDETGKPLRESLARAISKYLAWKLEQAKAEL